MPSRHSSTRIFGSSRGTILAARPAHAHHHARTVDDAADDRVQLAVRIVFRTRTASATSGSNRRWSPRQATGLLPRTWAAEPGCGAAAALVARAVFVRTHVIRRRNCSPKPIAAEIVTGPTIINLTAYERTLRALDYATSSFSGDRSVGLKSVEPRLRHGNVHGPRGAQLLCCEVRIGVASFGARAVARLEPDGTLTRLPLRDAARPVAPDDLGHFWRLISSRRLEKVPSSPRQDRPPPSTSSHWRQPRALSAAAR